jgi:uncharacterized protein (TIGR02118 family)
VIKVLAPALRHPTNRLLADFHRYWADTHGPLFANTRRLRRYVQHLTLPEAYGAEPAPTFDGVSMFWFDDVEAYRVPEEPSDRALFDAVIADDRQLFDRSTDWPTHHRRAICVAEERVVVEGGVSPESVKVIFILARLPGLTLDEFSARWSASHGPVVARIPGLRRYVQNHRLEEAQGETHDGWAELWFDDLAALRSAAASPEWAAAREDGETLFAAPLGIGIARERVVKELDWRYHDWGVGAMIEEDVRRRLEEQGYRALARDPDAPRRIKAAAAREALALWMPEHLVTIDDSRIDARPG